ncbi:Uma2 family endonuclease [Streptomyces sp. NPDC058682]|uniref:Uma2 family endonuclease n=2 Tax=unclassified Streptomyces TaxID=2593676 RepID=UPI0036477368
MGATMTAEPVHDWSRPPLDGYTVDDLLTLPDLPRHTELIDGSLVFVSPQRFIHSDLIDFLVTRLRLTAPRHTRVAREMTVVIDKRNGPEPDISVVRREACTSPMQTHFYAADVLLAVEVVSPESEARDTKAKLHKYAAAGIPNYWIVKIEGDEAIEPVVYLYELDPHTRAYVCQGIHTKPFSVDRPFAAEIDFEGLDEM